MKTAVSPEQRIQGAIDIADRVVELASQQGVQLDGYAWAPDPSREKRPAEYYYLIISAGPKHCEAKFSRTLLEDRPAGASTAVRSVLEEMVRAVKG